MRFRVAGFTLLEILIALFIFTLISMIMTSVLHTLLNSQSATEKKSLRLTALETTFILLTNDLEQTINRSVLSNRNTLDSFMGTSTRVAFTHAGLINPQGLLQRSTLQRVEYFLDKEHFIRMTWPVLDQTSKTQGNQRVLLEDIEDVRFEYLDNDGHFHNSWSMQDSNALLPKAVRVTLKISHWGEITQLYLIPSQPRPESTLLKTDQEETTNEAPA
jgi:general secretion pathway protein J